ncbi:non-specific serine/threonine protein kinase [Tistlia consotensis]|uniref:Non-specific serine/threonine protein kinase n=1 Tax=Tistlia consotensis USBA 355 TaxID=560819 RepID=A0A1Y6BJ38_9PROT|nr:non-specific serine/threonine protein kinase [Tistlia consotensis USBA 355]SNR53740.1 non-specific serine/threonine protein kinase [Tistlia consotensis]
MVFESRGWEIDLARRELRARGSPVPIGNRAFEIIETLVRSAGELVTKDDLMSRVWPGAIVGDNTLQVHISAIRRAFGADRGMLKTVAGRGYRLLGDWTIRERSAPAKRPSGSQVRTASHPFLTNVPVAASALIGRETAVQHLRDLLSAYRVVTLAGPGGIGKTVLASEVARRLVPALESDVLLVELVSLSDPELVPSAVASTLDLQLRGDEMSPAAVARALGGRKVLLLLDNCEHVIDAAATMAETLLRLCPHATVLATSREVLRIEGEVVYRVPPLEVPAEDLEASDEVLEHSAVQLFVARTRSLRSDFQPQADKLPVIGSICRQLDGIPLAIELAAARAATLGIQQVAGRLDDRLALLTGGRRTALPRHQTLRATLDWSYELLPEPERRLLRQLAIFPAGFTLEAAMAVSGDSESSVALGISSLVTKSLVALDGSEAARRWRLLETVRVYAFEKLADSGDQGQVVRRHAEFCLSLFAPFAVEGELQAAIDDLARFRREVDNLRAALSWAFSACGDTSLGVALAATATDFWVAVSLVAECCEWAGKALAALGEAAGTYHEMVLQCGLGFALIFTQGMGAAPREALIRTLSLARQSGDFDYQQRATYGLWLFSARAMALDDALAFAREYEEVARVRGLQSRAMAAWLVGIPQTYLAAHDEAGERLRWAIDHYPVERRRRDMIRFASDLRASAMSHNTVNLLSQGLVAAASQTAMSAIEEARRTNQPTVLCVALAWAAGFVFLSLDELELAQGCGEELVDHAERHALHPFHAVGLCVQGALAARRGDPEGGVAPLRSGLAEMARAVYLLFYPFFRAELAAALAASGLLDDGLGEIDEALRFAETSGYLWFVPEILRIKGELLARRGLDDPAPIEDLFRRSMAQARAQKATYWELSSATSLAEHLCRHNRQAEAGAVLSPVYGRLTEGLSAPRVKRARALLDRLA